MSWPRCEKAIAKTAGRDHQLASALWKERVYEARTVAVLVEEPERVTGSQMDAWASDFDSWAICDTACFHLFDRTPHAWTKVHEWAPSPHEYVKRAAYALVWSLSRHDKTAGDERFLDALRIVEEAPGDPRPYVQKGMDMALRATGKRNPSLARAAMRTARVLAASDDSSRAWVGKHALRELSRLRSG